MSSQINKPSIYRLMEEVVRYPAFNYSLAPSFSYEYKYGDCGCAIVVMKLCGIENAIRTDYIQELGELLGLDLAQSNYLFNNETEQFLDDKAEFKRRAEVLLGEAEKTADDECLLGAEY